MQLFLNTHLKARRVFRPTSGDETLVEHMRCAMIFICGAANEVSSMDEAIVQMLASSR